MDSGYPNKKGFLAPYRNTRYHLPEFQAVEVRGRNEVFNNLHSSLRNVIERSFGVLKKRFDILQRMPPYEFKTQVRIVVAAMAVHNFIIEQRMQDDFLSTYGNEEMQVGLEDDNVGIEAIDNDQETTLDEIEMGVVRDNIRDAICMARGVNTS